MADFFSDKLTPTEGYVFKVLAANVHRYLTEDQIADMVRERYLTRAAVHVHLYKMRSKFIGALQLINQRGLGYRLSLGGDLQGCPSCGYQHLCVKES